MEKSRSKRAIEELIEKNQEKNSSKTKYFDELRKSIDERLERRKGSNVNHDQMEQVRKRLEDRIQEVKNRQEESLKRLKDRIGKT